MNVKKLNFILAIVFVIIASFGILASAIEPNGASITAGTPGRVPNDTAGNNLAFAGNVTRADLFGYSTTEAWQGYFGNVTGVIQLADSADKVLYNWSLATPEGEVYASINN